MRYWTGFVLATLAVAALAAGTWPVAGENGGGTAAAAEPNATTVGPQVVNATSAGLAGSLSVAENDTTWAVWIEYRVQSSDGDWNRTRSRNATSVDATRGPWTFLWNVSGLQPGTTYEYRTLAGTSNATDTGTVRTFTTDERPGGSSSTPTETPVPCPSYRGGGAFLCTTTPTPTDPGDLPPDGRPASPSGDGDRLHVWLTSLLPLVAWAAAGVVVAPLVLGSLLWIDSMRRRGRE